MRISSPLEVIIINPFPYYIFSIAKFYPKFRKPVFKYLFIFKTDKDISDFSKICLSLKFVTWQNGYSLISVKMLNDFDILFEKFGFYML